MKTSRQQLLEYVEQHKGITAEELSRVLHMTQANVRHHLDILKEQNLVEVIGYRPAEGKGRPPRFFGPSEKSFGNNLGLLSGILFQEIDKVLSPELKGNFIVLIAQMLLCQISSRINPDQSDLGNPRDREMIDFAKSDPAKSSKGISTSLSQRLYNTIRDLNRFHYYARWEAHVESPRVILGHCPYPGVPNEHPEICRVDSILLAGLLSSEVAQIARLVKDKRGVPSCVFRVRGK